MMPTLLLPIDIISLHILRVLGPDLGVPRLCVCAAQDGGGDLIIMNQLKSTFKNFAEVARTELVGGWDEYSSMCTWQGVTCTNQGFVQVSARLLLCLTDTTTWLTLLSTFF